MEWQRLAIQSSDLTLDEIAAHMRSSFPRASKAALSYAQRPKETGVTFTPSANKALAVLLGVTPPKKAKRKRPVRIQARLTEAETKAFNASRAVLKHSTVNDAIRYAVKLYITDANRRTGNG